ncbi:SRPBCC family protein [Pedobacter gandavensis]|uniref:SRPBCC family protein n=1 Tax=Pedobacter gandavensis TaxID=2679963 RepID=UPI002930943D|nr:SRPBCC family protein [Pedobacter gandavensis]
MKKIILSLLLLTGLSTIKANAQMEAAQKVVYDVNKEATINMPQMQVWAYLNQPEHLLKASNGYATSIKIVDPAFPVAREVVFADGSKRTETINQLEQEHKFMVIQLGTEYLPKGVSEAEIVIFTREKGNQCLVNWRAKIKGKGEGKKALIEKLTAEFNSYAAGFELLSK